MEEKCVSSIGLPAIKEAKLATRICLLCCDQIIIPASSYFESEICKEIIKEHEDLIALGMIIFVGNAGNSLEFIQNKISKHVRSTDIILDISGGGKLSLAMFQVALTFGINAVYLSRDSEAEWIIYHEDF